MAGKDGLEMQRNGYQETIEKGIKAVRNLGRQMSYGTGTKEERLERLKKEMETAEAVVIGAGAGLSTSAGFTYSGERFERYFSDFRKKYGFQDMYSGGFYPYPKKEEFWAYWARYIYINRYMDAPKPVYQRLFERMREQDYFVITTNVDHQFQKAGFDKRRLFYTQGDYGLFQSVNPDIRETFDNQEWVMQAMEAQSFEKGEDGMFRMPENGKISMEIPAELFPVCPVDGSEFVMNLRSDDSFVEDAGWHKASERYADFLHRNEGRHVLYLELGVGSNTPVIIKYPFWQMTASNEKAVYACVNYGEAVCPAVIEKRSVCIDEDIGVVMDGMSIRMHTDLQR